MELSTISIGIVTNIIFVLGLEHISIYSIILFGGDSVGSFCSSRPLYTVRGTGILGQIAWFERRLRGAAQTPLALPYPFRIST